METVPTARIALLYAENPADKLLMDLVGQGVLYGPQEQLLVAVTPKFELVQNQAVMEAYAPLADQCFASGGRVFFIERRGTLRLVFLKEVTGGEFEVGVLVTNSMASRSMFKVEPAVVKHACTNGMVVRAFSEVKRFAHVASRRDAIATLMGDEVLAPVLEQYLEAYEELRGVADPAVVARWVEKFTKKQLLSKTFLEVYQEQWGTIQTAQDVFDAVTYKGSHKGEDHFDFAALAAAEGLLLHPAEVR